MANLMEIRDAFQALGRLSAAEHAEGDEEGVIEVSNLMRALRKFAKHEQKEHRGMREAVLEHGDGRRSYYQSDDTIRDLADLYAVLGEHHHTGSPNVENLQAKGMLDHVQRGGLLSESQIGLMLRLLKKHGAKIDRLRRSRDRNGQDLLSVPSGGPESRFIDQKG